MDAFFLWRAGLHADLRRPVDLDAVDLQQAVADLCLPAGTLRRLRRRAQAVPDLPDRLVGRRGRDAVLKVIDY